TRKLNQKMKYESPSQLLT
ncbi:unnamed protein product, partial [Allacma fusca]